MVIMVVEKGRSGDGVWVGIEAANTPRGLGKVG